MTSASPGRAAAGSISQEAAELPSGTVGAARAAWLLTRLRLRREWNRVRSAYRWRRAPPGRTGTGRKAAGLLLTAVVLAAMLANFINLSHRSLVNIESALGWVEVYKQVPRGWIGVHAVPVTRDIGERRGIRPARGALITALSDAGPAKSAGLRTGDVVLEVDGRRINQVADLGRLVSTFPAGTNVRVLINRDGRSETRALTIAVLPVDARPFRRPVAPAPGSKLPPGVLNAATLEASLLLLATVLVTLAAREIARPELDLEWLATLPLPLSALIAGRLVERAATNIAGLLTLGPFLSVLAWRCGYRLTAPLLGMGLTVALLFVVATIQTLVDTGLRLKLSPPRLRNLQAVISLIGVLPLLVAVSMAVRDDTFVFRWAAALPSWTGLLPTGLAVRALAATTGGAAFLWSALATAQVLAFTGIGYVLMQWQLRDGVVAAGTRERVACPPVPSVRTGWWERAWERLPPVQRRELLLLGRDRAFLVQTLLVPAITVAAQVFINAHSNVFVGAVDHPGGVAAIAFAVAACMLMFSAFQTLNAEGQALWILCSVPRTLESVLREKAWMWAALAMIYPGLIFALAFGVAGRLSTQFVVYAAVVLAGVPIFAIISTALGVFGCDPLAPDVQRRIRPTYLYLYMVLVSLYAFAIYASTIWQRAATVILTSLLAAALWQKARDQLDYLLDPSATPPSRVSVSDGLIAALMFFVLQAFVAIALRRGGSGMAAVEATWIAFCAAGAVTYAVMRLVYWRAGTAGVPRVFGAGMSQASCWGIAGGVVASLGGIAYIEIAHRMGLVAPVPAPTGATAFWLFCLAVAAAPVFEEFIFRGLIFGGLRRTVGPITATLASAAIFAIVHPPMSVVPVLFMAICAGLVYERTRMLAAPMMVHAVYNAAVLGLQWSVMH